ncbi:MutS protein msh4, partial [Tieghemiomyces parasiticus]
VILVKSTGSSLHEELSLFVHSALQGTEVRTGERKHFDSVAGLDFVRTYAFEATSHCALQSIMTTKYYCAGAVAAVFSHLERTGALDVVFSSLRFQYTADEDTVAIDPKTAAQLELVASLRGDTTGSLFHILNHTRTPMGARLLRVSLLQPLANITAVMARQNVVEELLNSEAMFFGLRKALKDIPDLDGPLAKPEKAKLHHAQQNVSLVIALKKAVESIRMVSSCLDGARHETLVGTKKVFERAVTEILSPILAVVDDEVNMQKGANSMRHIRCYVVKAGYDSLLDLVRQVYQETIDDIYGLVQTYCENFGVTIRLQFNSTTGFYLSIQATEKPPEELDPIFINVVRKGKILRFTTLEILKMNDRVNNALAEITLMSDKALHSVVENLRSRLGLLDEVSAKLADLDLAASFADLCTRGHYVRPQFGATLKITEGRHPALDKARGSCTANEVHADLEASPLTFVCGGNRSGKTTYLKQIALLHIMAHAGAYLPASHAVVRPLRQILARFCHDDGRAGEDWRVSSFTAEVLDVAAILDRVPAPLATAEAAVATDEGTLHSSDHGSSKGTTTLVLIDELGRATAPAEGASLAYAVARHLAVRPAITFFATHAVRVVEHLRQHPRIKVVSFGVPPDTAANGPEANTHNAHRLQVGPVSSSAHYGILAARLLRLPKAITDRAAEIAYSFDRPIVVESDPGACEGPLLRELRAFQATSPTLAQWQAYLKKLQQELVGHRKAGRNDILGDDATPEMIVLD